MNLFLTGASGFLGTHTAFELSRRGHSLTALVRKTSQVESLRSLPIRWVEGALPEGPPPPSFFEEIDAVIHIAGVVKALTEKEFIRVNSEGTESLVRAVLASRRRPKHFLHISTIAVHDSARDGSDFCLPPSLCHPLSAYGRSKLAGEKALEPLKGQVQTLVLRPPVLYGPRDRELLPLFRSIRWKIAPLLQSGENTFSICYIEDVAGAVADLVESPLSSDEIFCLDDGTVHSWKSLSKAVSLVMEKKALSVPIPMSLFKFGAGLSQAWAKLRGRSTIFTLDKVKEMEQPSWVCGYERLHARTGWRPRTPLNEGLKKTRRYYQDAGLI